MPIPQPPGGAWKNAEQAKKAYNELGWFKEVVFEWVSFNSSMRTWIVSTCRANAANFPCTLCPTGSEYVYLTLTPSGIVQTCVICQHTHGTLSHQLGGKTLIPTVSQRAITLREALKIIARTGQVPPPGMKLNQPGDHARKLLVDVRVET